MAEVAFDLGTDRSKSFEQFSSLAFDAVVTMGCGDERPWVPAQRRKEWALRDPKHLDDAGYRAVRDDISARVKPFLESLA
ncbi:MAG: hypothetical protein M3495_06955 [Pseudomonadota bacterium]|nr:hypothetical protein [Pseudomonadota bacterium]